MDTPSLIGPTALTERQPEVARLVERGLTNPQIAQELGITLDGAKYHVSELLVRLGVDRREDVAGWYRQHFGARARLRALLTIPALGTLSPGAIALATASVAATALVIALVINGQVRILNVDDGEYPPFVMEMAVTPLESPSTFEVLDWNSYADWELRVYDRREGLLLGETRSDPQIAAEGSRHIPSHWFRPVNSWRANSLSQQVAENTWELTYTRSCTEISNWEQRHDLLPPTFCPTRADTFEDRTVAEFDVKTDIPIRETVYLNGIEVSDRVSVSLQFK